jgi:murein DD-endopeptidase MepM/ murein hydrolase activator NlpD
MATIYRAVKTNFLTQGFNSNPNMVDYYKKLGLSNHGGYDWAAKDGEPIYFDCSGKGIVLNTEIDNNGGLGVNIITEDEDGIFKHRYWHLKSFAVVAGQELETGDLIGYADNTGLSTGTHLHRDQKEMIKDQFGNYQIKNRDNGSFGTVEMKNFTNIFVLDYLKSQKEQISLLQRIIDVVKKLLGLQRPKIK